MRCHAVDASATTDTLSSRQPRRPRLIRSKSFVCNARLPPGRSVVSKLGWRPDRCTVAAGVFLVTLFAEVIASAFASGFSWGGNTAEKHVYCAPPNLKGHEIMAAFEGFLSDQPEMADRPYGAAMASTLSSSLSL